MAQSSSWKDLAEQKRNAIFNSIPPKWQIQKSKLPANNEQRDVTGYIQQFLSKREVEITETDVIGIAKETSAGNWTAAEVAEAFCHRASLAHQLVSYNWLHSTSSVGPHVPAKVLAHATAYEAISTNPSLISYFSLGRSLTDRVDLRRIASMKPFSMLPSPMPKPLTSISQKTRNQ
jgi:hypothetical protein